MLARHFIRFAGALVASTLWSTVSIAAAGNPCARDGLLLGKATAVEYVRADGKRSVWTGNRAEWAALDGPSATGWVRTGRALQAFARPSDASLSPCYPVFGVMRYYNPQSISHFLTVSPEERAILDQPASGWIPESSTFYTYPAHDTNFKPDFSGKGTCERVASSPVYRAYNNRAQFGDAAHRFTPDKAEYEELLRHDWIGEGVAFCAALSLVNPTRVFTVATGTVLPSPVCEDESRGGGPCVAWNQVPALSERARAEWVAADGRPSEPRALVQSFALGLAPSVHEGDEFRRELSIAQLPGALAASNTLFALADDPTIAVEHSYVRAIALRDDTTGKEFDRSAFEISVNSRDRTVGELASINPLYQLLTTKTGDKDSRVMPWAKNERTTVEVAFDIHGAYVHRNNDRSHAYGGPTLEWIDTTTRRNVYVTLQVFGTQPYGEFVSIDASTGKPIVSTLLSGHDRPLNTFGETLLGNVTQCPGALNTWNRCDLALANRFRLRAADFKRVIALARNLVPELSANIADYALDNFHFNNEVLGDAALKIVLSGYRLELFEN